MENRSAVCRAKHRLARGRQVRVEWRQDRPILVQPSGTVQLNESAAAILELCDGTRTCEELISHFAASGDLAGDVRDFLNAARQRGWIVDT